MSNLNLRTITNHFLDVRLVSLSSWRQAREIEPRDHGGPYVVLQEGYDPADTKMIPMEFVIGRSGKWIPLGQFYKLPVPERRAEFVFGTAAEIMQMMERLPTKPQILGTAPGQFEEPAEDDPMAAAIESNKKGKM